MNVKQLTYTALNQGWTIERTFGSPSEKECAEFSSICSQSSVDATLYAYAFSKGVGIIYRSVPYGVDAVGRRRFYSHGYVFSGIDCDEMFKEHQKLLSVDYFAESENAEFRNFDEIVKDFHPKFEKTVAVTLTEAVYECLLDNKIMEIYHNTDDSETLIRAVMNTIFDFIPSKLRKFASFSTEHIGSISKVTVTKVPCGYADIKYNLKTGECEGINGTYRDFVTSLFTDEKESYLAELENVMGDKFTSDINTCIQAIKTAISDIVFRAETKKPLSPDKIRTALELVLGRKQFANPVDIEYMIAIFTKLFKSKITIDGIFDTELIRVYNSTSSSELKTAIMKYLVLLYSHDMSTSFHRLLAVNELNNGLYVELTKLFLALKHEDFLIPCAEYAINNPLYCSFIADTCGDKSASVLANAVADNIARKGADKNTFSTLIKLPVHTATIKYLLTKNMDADTFWNYLYIIYSNPENINEYRKLDVSSLKACENFFYTELPLHEEDVLCILGEKYSYKDKVYMQIEKMLISCRYTNLVLRLYAEKFALTCTDCEAFEAQKRHLEKIGLPTSTYVAAVIESYSRFCFDECEKKHLSEEFAIRNILAFAKGANLADLPQVKKIKEDFWNRFDFKNFAFSEDVSAMSLPDNEKSLCANALLSLYRHIQGLATISDTDYGTCLKVLCLPNKFISVKGREHLIRRMREVAYRKNFPNMEITLLLNYSPSKNRLKANRESFPLEVLCKYILANFSRKNTILQMPPVAKSLLKHLRKASKNVEKKCPAARKTFPAAFATMRGIVRKNSLKAKLKKFCLKLNATARNRMYSKRLGYIPLLLLSTFLVYLVAPIIPMLVPIFTAILCTSALLIVATALSRHEISTNRVIFALLLAIYIFIFTLYSLF
ncbi:MAG: hypothetical protein IKU84_06380 [Clostridia bacterium]|nr:hypothetical protein [Clostridia bacterium]